MVSMKSIVRKAGAAAILTAAIVGLSAGQASAAGGAQTLYGTLYEGTKADVLSKANAQIPSLKAACLARFGSPGDPSVALSNTAKNYTAQASLLCWISPPQQPA